MTATHQRRVAMLTRLEVGALGVAEVAELLGVSARQVRRLRQRLAEDKKRTDAQLHAAEKRNESH